jgi:large subunit ribosomal protein MRP49
LLWIRVGPGALTLPKEVQKISLEFNTKINGGHRGARKFWRDILPRIKYRNPALPITIMRHTDRTGPAKLHIFTSTSSSPDTPSTTIDVKMLPESQILAELVAATKAEEIAPTEKEVEELREIEEFKRKSQADRDLVREKFLAGRREEEMMRLARREVEGQ